MATALRTAARRLSVRRLGRSVQRLRRLGRSLWLGGPYAWGGPYGYGYPYYGYGYGPWGGNGYGGYGGYGHDRGGLSGMARSFFGGY